MRAVAGVTVLLFAFLMGCNQNSKPTNPSPAPATNAPPPTTWTPVSPDMRDLAQPVAQPQPPVQPQPQPGQPTPPVAGPGTQPPMPGNVGQPTQPPLTAPQTTELVKAGKGVGQAGRSLDQNSGVAGIIVEPARVYFAAKERILFEDQIPKQVQLDKLQNNDKVPQTWDEFKARILDPCQIRLPELPPNQRYIWDPKEELLKVERPGR